MYPLLEKERGVRVPQIVEPNPGQALRQGILLHALRQQLRAKTFQGQDVPKVLVRDVVPVSRLTIWLADDRI